MFNSIKNLFFKKPVQIETVKTPAELENDLARDLVRFYFNSDDIKFKPESKGTVRFSDGALGLQGFYRIRSRKDRGLGSNHENSFDQVHVGRLTIAVERTDGRDIWNFAVGALNEA